MYKLSISQSPNNKRKQLIHTTVSNTCNVTYKKSYSSNIISAYSCGKSILTDRVRNFIFLGSMSPEGLSMYVPSSTPCSCSTDCVYNIPFIRNGPCCDLASSLREQLTVYKGSWLETVWQSMLVSLSLVDDGCIIKIIWNIYVVYHGQCFYCLFTIQRLWILIGSSLF